MENKSKVISFIDFLKAEFGIGRDKRYNGEPIKSLKGKKGAVKFLPFDFQKKPKELEKVLAVKIADEEEKEIKNTKDLDDLRVNQWGEILEKNKIFSEKRKAKGFWNRIDLPKFTNVPGVLSFCREKESEEFTFHPSMRAVSLVIAVLIFSIFSLATFPEVARQLKNGATNAFALENDEVKRNDQPIDKELLAQYIRDNDNEIKNRLAAGKGEVKVKEDEIFGRVAGAMETATSVIKEKNGTNDLFLSAKKQVVNFFEGAAEIQNGIITNFENFISDQLTR